MDFLRVLGLIAAVNAGLLVPLTCIYYFQRINRHWRKYALGSLPIYATLALIRVYTSGLYFDYSMGVAVRSVVLGVLALQLVCAVRLNHWYLKVFQGMAAFVAYHLLLPAGVHIS